jgi:starch phosphorylase
MWQNNIPDSEVENKAFAHVTNGVHLPTWLEPKLKMLFDRYLGASWMDDHDNPVVWEMIDKIPDQELWHAH